MAALRFVTGPVASGKTLDLVAMAHRMFQVCGEERVAVLKPAVDTRFPSRMVKSVAGPHVRATHLVSPIEDLTALDLSAADYVFVDELQFFTVEQVRQMRRIATERNVGVSCYGLLKDFKCQMFPASMALLELCDDVRFMNPECMRCRATRGRMPEPSVCSMRIARDGDRVQAVVEGDSIAIGGIETYIPVCYECYHAETGHLGKG